jgi:hypothetical protein
MLPHLSPFLPRYLRRSRGKCKQRLAKLCWWCPKHQRQGINVGSCQFPKSSFRRCAFVTNKNSSKNRKEVWCFVHELLATMPKSGIGPEELHSTWPDPTHSHENKLLTRHRSDPISEVACLTGWRYKGNSGFVTQNGNSINTTVTLGVL